jgi:hypothetical protein
MATPKPKTNADVARSMKAQLVRLYTAACDIAFPKDGDTAFRNALQARLTAGVASITPPCLDIAQDALIDCAQTVRLYEASAKLRANDDVTLKYRYSLQREISAYFRLREAVKNAEDADAAEKAAKAMAAADPVLRDKLAAISARCAAANLKTAGATPVGSKAAQ